MAVNDDLFVFVREALGRGTPRGAVADALGRAGWESSQVRAALGAFAEVEFPIPVPRPRPSLSARDAFLYLVLFSMLYTVAIHLGGLAFLFIERAFPDAATPAWAGQPGVLAGRFRWAISTLLVSLPVFLFMAARIRRETDADPVKRTSTVRRWLSYLTLFVGASVLICDVVALVYTALSGELTTRFVLKACTVGAIASAAFAYVWDLRGDGDAAVVSAVGRIAVWGIAAAGSAAIAGGFVLAGSPSDARRQRLDNVRVEHVQRLAAAIDVQWTRTRRLPDTTDALLPGNASLATLRDPVTGAPYEYRVVGADAYELCATFDREGGATIGASPPIWAHDAGRVCFALRAKNVSR